MNSTPLTYDEWQRVISRFKSSMIRLRQSNDYPEHKEDERILRKMFDLQFDQIGE